MAAAGDRTEHPGSELSPDESWDRKSVTGLALGEGLREHPMAWLGARIDDGIEHLLQRFKGDTEAPAGMLLRDVRGVQRWRAFPRGVRMATAGTSLAASGLALWGLVSLVGSEFVQALMAAGAAGGLTMGALPLGARLADRLHGLIARRRRRTIAQLRAVPERRAVAVRGVVLAQRTAASALDSRPAVWSLTRFRKGGLFSSPFFHETAYDFLIDDGTDDPIWIEVSGGMLLGRFPNERRVLFASTTLLHLDHPFLTRLRLADGEVRASELAIAAGDVVDVVGRLARRLDPSAASQSGRVPPERRVLRSGMRVPVMVKRVDAADLKLARVPRQTARRSTGEYPGEPPIPRF